MCRFVALSKNPSLVEKLSAIDINLAAGLERDLDRIAGCKLGLINRRYKCQ